MRKLHKGGAWASAIRALYLAYVDEQFVMTVTIIPPAVVTKVNPNLF